MNQRQEDELLAAMRKAIQGRPQEEWEEALDRGYPFGLTICWSFTDWMRLRRWFLDEHTKALQLREAK